MSDEFKVQWSISLPPAAQYAKGDMLNLRGGTVSEVEGIFDEILNSDFIEKATDVANLLRGAAVVTDSGATTESAPATESAPVAGHVCQHGKREHRKGTNKAGKPYEGWFCPEKNRNAQCDVVWADR